MRGKNKKKIQSTILNILSILMVLTIVLMTLYEIFIPNGLYNIYVSFSLLISGCLSCTIYLFLIFICGFKPVEKNKKVKADLYQIAINNYKTIIDNIDCKLKIMEYKLSHEEIFDDYRICFYTKYKSGLEQKFSCYIIIKFNELPRNYRSIVGNAGGNLITNFLNKFDVKKINYCDINLIVIVDKENNYFKNWLNSGIIQQGYNDCYMLVGISLDTQIVYVANPKDWYCIANYRKLKNNILNLLQLTKEMKLCNKKGRRF